MGVSSAKRHGGGSADRAPLRTARHVRLPPLLLTSGPLPPTVPVVGFDRPTRAETAEPARAEPRTRLDLRRYPPDPSLIEAFGAKFCLCESVLPWKTSATATIVAVHSFDQMRLLQFMAPAHLPPLHPILMRKEEIEAALLRSLGAGLAQDAETRVLASESCRQFSRLPRVLAFLCLGALIGGVLLQPQVMFWAGLGLTLGLLFLFTCLKIVVGLQAWQRPFRLPPPFPIEKHLPYTSILVPLFRETHIATQLIGRLKRLDYPRDKLEIKLIVEEDDAQTRSLMGQARLPEWMQVVVVPPGQIQTKPRALNYALNFCTGTVIGVYDAEDAPEPSQLRKVAAHFAQVDPDVACLQGALDFYNTRSSWLARFFAIEYATWFRVILPGLQRLGLPIPLGGTTLFFRRDVLEEIGAWDAHNVTEDADLGVRLARYGYRTELIETVTREEAVCQTWPWIKQRSRWLKGYALTWMVHMRRPDRLWRDLGGWGFFGIQLVFLGTLLQFFLAPILWSLWLLMFGVPHPLSSALAPAGIVVLAGFLLFSELVGIAVSALALTKTAHRRLIYWVPGMMLYMPLATIAAYRGLWGMVRRPYYWDKTAHGVSLPDRFDLS